MFAVVVTFTLKPGRLAEALALVRENADRSLAVEAECHRFDVATDPARPEEILLYELYTDRAGFEAHLSAPHFLSFDMAVAEMIDEKQVRTYREVNP